MNKAHMMDHNQTALQTAQRRHRILWLSGAAFGAAIAANALFMSSASAQALKGGFNPVGPGSATIVRTSTPTGLKDTITINQPTAVINWTPTDTAANAAAINFLGANDSVEFRGDSAFTVLNRIIPVSTAASRRIALNGSVTGSVGGVVGAAGANVWFYTPNGFLIGSTAQFNMGGLVLSTLDHPFNISGGALSLNNNGASDWGSTTPPIATSSIAVSNQARFTLNSENAYLAMISPRVEQGGRVSVNGSVAYVSAEAVSIGINAGLFDINITQGTGDANGIVHTGETTGVTTAGSSSARAITLAAIPKNTALTMLVGGTLGYQPAASASTVNGTIVLSAGFDPGSSTAEGEANIVITARELGSSISASSTGFTSVERLVSTGSLDIDARGDVNIGTVDAGGSVSISSGRFGDGSKITFQSIAARESIDLTADGLVAGNSMISDDSIRIRAGDVEIQSATARGTFIDGNGNQSEGFIFVSSANDIILNNANARTLIGVGTFGITLGTARGSISGNGTWIAGEDILAYSSNDVSLSDVSAGDDLSVIAVGNIAIRNGTTTGSATDSRRIFAEGPNFGVGTDNTNGNSDITLLSTTELLFFSGPENNVFPASISSAAGFGFGNISAGNLSSASDIFGVTNGTLRISGTATARGIGPATSASSIRLVADDITVANADAVTNIFTFSQGNIDLGNLTAGGIVGARSDGAITAGNIFSRGTGIALISVGSITTGDLNAANGVVALQNEIGAITTGLITVANDFALTTTNRLNLGGVSAGDDIRITTASSADLGRLTTRGNSTDQEGDGRNIVLNVTGDLTVVHANAIDNFTVTANRFETGLNTIITGGDIDITTVGDAILGNSQAGGFIQVSAGGAIDFNAIQSGGFTQLSAGGLTTGLSSIAGGTFNASSDSGITIGTVSSVALAQLSVDAGDLSVGTVTSTGDISIENFGVGATSVLNNAGAGGDLTVSANGTVSIAAAQATGTFVDGNGNLRDGNIFVTTIGAANMGPAAASRMIGITGSNIVGTGAWTGGEDIFVQTSGTANLAAVSAGDDLRINAAGGVTLSNGSARGRALTEASLGLRTSPTLQFRILDGEIAGSSIEINSASGGITAGVLTAAERISGTAANLVTITNATAGTAFTLNAGQTSLGTIRAATINITSGQGVIFNQLFSTGITTLTAGDDITGTLIDSDGALTLNANRNIVVGTVDAATLVSQTAGSTQFGSVSTTGTATIIAPAGIIINTTAIGGTLLLTATNGPVLVRNDLRAAGPVTATGLSVDLTSLGSVTFGNLTATNGALAASVAGTLTLNGIATGNTVALRSSDIVINPAAARVGTSGITTNASLTNSGAGQTYIGGNGGTGGYGLSNVEAQRIFADNITVIAPRRTTGAVPGNQTGAALSTRAPDVILDTLTLTGANGQTGPTAGNIGTNGIFTVQTAGKLRTIGTVTFNNLTAGNRFSLIASEMLEVDPATGSINLRNASGGLGGILSMTSDDIIAASAAAINDVIAAPTMRSINARLDVNDGAINDQGVFSANSIVVNARNGFYIQNTGVNSTSPVGKFDLRRGFTVGSGGIEITSGGPAARIVINGRQTNAAGGFTTGIDALRLVSIAGLFDLGSTANGCALSNPATCTANFEEIGITRDTIARNSEEDGTGGGNLLPVALIQLKDVEALGYQPIIDDPVTGAGNDDLWAVDDEREKEEAAPAAPAPQ